MPDFSTLPAHLQSAYRRDPRRRQIDVLQGRAFGNVQHPLQGLAQLLMAYKAGEKQRGMESEYAGKGEEYRGALSRALQAAQGGTRDIPRGGHPGIMDVPSRTERTPGDFGEASRIMSGVGAPEALRFAELGFQQQQTAAERARAAEALKNQRAYDEVQANIAFERQKELKGIPTPKERRIVEGADGRKYYADTGEAVLKGVKTPQEKFLEMLGGPEDELGGGAGEDVLRDEIEADISAPPADIVFDEGRCG